MKSYLPAALFGTALTAVAIGFGATAEQALAGSTHPTNPAVVVVADAGAR